MISAVFNGYLLHVTKRGIQKLGAEPNMVKSKELKDDVVGILFEMMEKYISGNIVYACMTSTILHILTAIQEPTNHQIVPLVRGLMKLPLDVWSHNCKGFPAQIVYYNL